MPARTWRAIAVMSPRLGTLGWWCASTARERVDLGEPRGLQAKRLPGEAHGLDAAANAAVQQRCLARWMVHVGSPVRWALIRRTGRSVERQEKGAEGGEAFGSGGRNHPWAEEQARSSLEPFAHPAITPGPCRGWGRHRLAHIRAQREPSVSPAGTGTEYR